MNDPGECGGSAAFYKVNLFDYLVLCGFEIQFQDFGLRMRRDLKAQYLRLS